MTVSQRLLRRLALINVFASTIPMLTVANSALPDKSPDPAPAHTARFSPATFKFHQQADRITEILIYAMVIFSPWAFGCTNSQALLNLKIFGVTQAWTIWAMNFAGYVLGGLLLTKLAVNFRTGQRPPRWGDPVSDEPPAQNPLATLLQRAAAPVLALLTVAILLYCLVSAVNVRANYRPDLFSFEYFDHYVSWLPHSYDGQNSWIAFWNYLGLAGAFWGFGGWLLGKTSGEIRAGRKAATAASFSQVTLLPERLRRLLWVLSINGAMLGIEGFIQRLSGTDKLLWFYTTNTNHDAQDQFGPYAYRSNAAQYFNLLWPVALGFWWTLRRAAHLTAGKTGQTGSRRHQLLLPAVMIMAICPIISMSRGGAIIALVNLALAALILMAALKRAHGATKFGLFVFVLAILYVGFAVGGEKLGDRMKEQGLHDVTREQMYEVGRAMAAEHPVFGSGPGSFNMLFQFYRTSREEYWGAQLHNDWLETRITFGWVGSALIAAALLVIAMRRYLPGGIQCGWRFAALIWVGLIGCLAHARFDFPFQIYSILFLFLVLCAILFNLSRSSAR